MTVCECYATVEQTSSISKVGIFLNGPDDSKIVFYVSCVPYWLAFYGTSNLNDFQERSIYVPDTKCLVS